MRCRQMHGAFFFCQVRCTWGVRVKSTGLLRTHRVASGCLTRGFFSFARWQRVYCQCKGAGPCSAVATFLSTDGRRKEAYSSRVLTRREEHAAGGVGMRCLNNTQHHGPSRIFGAPCQSSVRAEVCLDKQVKLKLNWLSDGKIMRQVECRRSLCPIGEGSCRICSCDVQKKHSRTNRRLLTAMAVCVRRSLDARKLSCRQHSHAPIGITLRHHPAPGGPPLLDACREGFRHLGLRGCPGSLCHASLCLGSV